MRGKQGGLFGQSYMGKKMSDKKKLVNKKEAAEIMSVSVRTVERMLASSELTKVKVRGAVRIRIDEIDDMLGGQAA